VTPLSHARAGARLVLVVGTSTALYALTVLGRALRRDPTARARVARAMTRRGGLRGARIVGLEVERRGPVPGRPALLTPNHLSYLDVIALAATTGSVFVSKADVARWPLVGQLFRGTGHLTVERRSRLAIGEAVDRATQALKEGVPVCAFLEGTSSGGDTVLPFRPSLAQAAVWAEVPVVPVALRYRTGDAAVTVVDHVAYWKPEHVFAPHLWRVLGLRRLGVQVQLGRPLACHGRSRKQLAGAAEDAVAQLLGLEGRQPPAARRSARCASLSPCSRAPSSKASR
jgi:1-acyl-sn-glycerol-3-phosphate acyltransferase